MIHTTQDFFEASQKYITLFDAFAVTHNLVGKTLADHICYKCGSTEEFERLRALFEHESLFVYQSIISKRRIAYIGFKTGIETALGTINYLELSDQKEDGSQKEGFDHIEVYPTVGSYEDMVNRLAETVEVTHVERPHHTTDDVTIGEGFLFRCTRGPLIEKIKASF